MDTLQNLKKLSIALVALVATMTSPAFAQDTGTDVSAPLPPAQSGGTVTNSQGLVTPVPAAPAPATPATPATPAIYRTKVYNTTTKVVVQSGHLGRALDAIEGGLTGHKSSVRDLGHLLSYKGGEKLAGTQVPPGGLLRLKGNGQYARNYGVSDAMLAEAIAKLDSHTGQAVREERAFVRSRLDTLNGDIQEVKGVQGIQSTQISQMQADLDGILQVDEAQNRVIKNHTERLDNLEADARDGQGADTRQNWWLSLLTLGLVGLIGFLFWRRRQEKEPNEPEEEEQEEEEQPANPAPAVQQPAAVAVAGAP